MRDFDLEPGVPLGIPRRVWSTILRGSSVIAVEPIDSDPRDTVIVCATPEPHVSALAGGDVQMDGGISGAAPAVFIRFQPLSSEVPELTLDLDLADPHSRDGVRRLVQQDIVVVSFVDSLRAQLVEQRALPVALWRDDIEDAIRAAEDYFA